MKLYRIVVDIEWLGLTEGFEQDACGQETMWLLAANESAARQSAYRIMSLTLKQIHEVHVDEVEEDEGQDNTLEDSSIKRDTH